MQFEDEGQFFSVLPPGKVRHISPADMNEEINEGDYVDAEWPADGKEYDAKVVKVGKHVIISSLGIYTRKCVCCVFVKFTFGLKFLNQCDVFFCFYNGDDCDNN